MNRAFSNTRPTRRSFVFRYRPHALGRLDLHALVVVAACVMVSPAAGAERMLMDQVPVPQASDDEKKIVDRIKACTVPGAGVGIWGGGDINSNWSFGTTATARLFQYNFTKGSGSVNAEGLGIGVAARYYPDSWMTTTKLKSPTEVDEKGDKDLRKIKPECRATSFSAKTLSESMTEGKVAFPAITFSATAFFSKPQGRDEINFAPTFIVGLLRDIIQVGFGYNATGPERKSTFLVVGVGTGFNF
ncbi:hypothetical protein [Nitrospira moscoviensis]|uniref:Uncharacterized protein n=1 Tax=Nitrospira moscoviensis TaxID=42253 RepID=A0A0K2GA37_NITMO|nr:hypothetical protein [Nitrospira moscoviensis]ALA57810.1 exported protein of unknown function [Nitrospira moscoviensis]